MIKEKKHFKSGVVEAGYYLGLSFVYFGLFFDSDFGLYFYAVSVFIFLLVPTIRYLDILTCIASIIAFAFLLFLTFDFILALIPFVMMISFALIFLGSQKLQNRKQSMIWEDHFIVLDTLCLLFVYVAGNYFVVRELSINMMGIKLDAGQDIPFAFLFYGFTFLIPIGYLVWGVLRKSLIFIRVSLLTLVITVITIKYYYLLDNHEVIITVAGAVMVLISLLILHYLKITRNGFTRNKILTSKWENSNLTAFIVSQSLELPQFSDAKDFEGKGGGFGGGGATGEF